MTNIGDCDWSLPKWKAKCF